MYTVCIYIYIYMRIWTANENIRSKERRAKAKVDDYTYVHIPNCPLWIQPDSPSTKSVMAFTTHENQLSVKSE